MEEFIVKLINNSQKSFIRGHRIVMMWNKTYQSPSLLIFKQKNTYASYQLKQKHICILLKYDVFNNLDWLYSRRTVGKLYFDIDIHAY